MGSTNSNLVEEHKSGHISWQSPANIALIKYWGKYPVQLPMNPSLSFVLNNSVVKISVDYTHSTGNEFRLASFTLNGQPNHVFASRISGYLQALIPFFPFLSHTILNINSHSSFPHSAGIASSAAAFSALALCICSMEQEVGGKDAGGKTTTEDNFFRKASYMARLGSGSACRSVYGGMVVWGKVRELPGSSDEVATTLDKGKVNPVFSTLRDAILIVDDGRKEVSSSAGHAMMQHHPYRATRIKQATANMRRILQALTEGNTEVFAEVVEEEALSLHSLMMSSSPGFILMRPNTLYLIDRIRNFREQSGLELCFTLDAGPNIHLLYFEKDQQQIGAFIRESLLTLCKQGRWIDDAMGDGPVRILEGR